MATEIQVNRAGTFEDISYSDFQINLGTSKAQIAPTAKVTSQVRESIQAGQELQIIIDGTTRFEGVTQSAGTKDRTGQRTVEVEHAGVRLMEEPVTLSLTTPTVSEVLNAAVDAADGGGSWTVDTAALPTLTLGNDYAVESRKVKRVFRDMVDRIEAVWWIEPTGETVHIEPPGDRGLWQSLNVQPGGSRIRVNRFDEGDVKTVRNDVEVIGTGDVAVSATETNTTSIGTYGRRTGESPYKVSYVKTEAEAGALAQALLQPDPLAQGKITVSQATGAVEVPQVNKTVDLADPSKDIDETDLTINEQVIRQSRAELSIGQGAGDAIARLNRNSKSEGDVTEPGSVYDSERIADNAIDSFKLNEGAVQSINLADGSVLTTKLENLAITETKIDDEAVTTPKVNAGAVTAAKVETGTITGTEFDRVVDGEVVDTQNIISLLADKVIFADTGDSVDGVTTTESGTTVIQGGKIETDSITANEIDTLDLDTGELSVETPSGDSSLEFQINQLPFGDAVQITPSGNVASAFLGGSGATFSSVWTDDVFTDTDNSGSVGSSSNAYAEMYAYEFIDANTGSAINDGGDPLAGLADGHGPPDHCEVCDDSGESSGYSLNKMARSVWDVVREQQRRIDSQRERINNLEDRIERLESQI